MVRRATERHDYPPSGPEILAVPGRPWLHPRCTAPPSITWRANYQVHLPHRHACS